MNKKNKTLDVGFFLNQIEDSFHFPFFAVAQKASQELGFNLIMLNGKSMNSSFIFDKHENVAYDLISNSKLDGIVILSTTLMAFLDNKEEMAFLEKYKDIPLVTVGDSYDNIPSVTVDNYSGMKELMNHMIEVHNCRRIAFVKGIETNQEALDRFSAYQDSLIEHKIPFEQELTYCGDFIYKGGLRAADYFVNDPDFMPDAIICANDSMASGVIDRLQQLEIKVPEDIKVTGFDNKKSSRFAKPSITTVNQPLVDVTYNAFELIINKHQKKQENNAVYPSRLVVRESCGCFPFYNIPEYSQPEVKDDIKYALMEQYDLENCEQSLIDDLSQGNSSGKFLQKMNIIFNVLFNENLKSNIPKQMELLKRRIVKLQTQKNKVTLDKIFEKLNQLIEEKFEIAVGTVANRYVDNMTRFRSLLSSISITTTMSDFLDAIYKEMIIAGINDFSIQLFDTPPNRISNIQWEIPNDCRQVLNVIKGKRVPLSVDGKVFNTKDLLPEFPEDTPFTIMTRTLYNRDRIFGYIVFINPRVDVNVYCNVHQIICSGLLSIYLWDEQYKIANSLKQQSRELEILNEKLSELDKLKTDFIQNITHDFKSPLTVIISAVSLALDHDKIMDETAKKRFEIISKASIRLKDSIDKLLELAKMDAEGVRLNISSINLNQFIENIVNFYQSAVSETSISITTDISAGKYHSFFTDKDKLDAILNNILSNAIKFVDPDDGTIELNVEEAEDSLRISVTDNGIGIEKENLDAIFTRFFQTSDGRKKRYSGTGIGLAYASQLANIMHGKLFAESDGKGKGTCFVLELPFVQYDEKQTSKHKLKTINSESRNTDNENSIRLAIEDNRFVKNDLNIEISAPNKENEFDEYKSVILIVEDNPVIMELEKDILSNEGYCNFILAYDGEQGLKAVNEYNPDIVICDYNMPNMNGGEFHDIVNCNPQHKDLPFLFVSAVTDIKIARERQEQGAVAIIKKPIDNQEFLLSTKTHLRRYLKLKETCQIATNDVLTGLLNRMSIMSKFNEQMSQNEFCDISIILGDIDLFKNINDTYGHLKGDEALKIVGSTIKHNIRKNDIAGRYGGEEFLILLPETSLNNGIFAIEKIRKKVEEQDIGLPISKPHITISFGMTSLFSSQKEIEKEFNIKNLGEFYTAKYLSALERERASRLKAEITTWLLNKADINLYKAKRKHCSNCGFTPKTEKETCENCGNKIVAGRNRVVYN
ncbi:MAG: diguanylate cyclase [Spirochaetes bacterium]|nr:diguanylate cyclase [Spirochaetota bacterium]MBN2769347.1 diguanylate cyclase [Spirochaetota bacterium]